MTDRPTYPPGTQVAYIPAHANGDINHPDVELGFVQEQRGDTALCRFWRKTRGKHQLGDLRTTANAESKNIADLVPHEHYKRDSIDSFLRVRGGEKLAQRKSWGMPLGARETR